MKTLNSTEEKNEKKIAPKIDAQLRVLFDNANELKVCMLNSAGNIIGWNMSAEKLTGYASKEVMGKYYTDFISREERRKNIFKKILQTASKRGSYTAEGIRVRKDGSHFWAQTFITPMKDSAGRVKFFILITKDISREKALAQKKEE
ncbi:MAG: PAS domain-containing protein [Candidatus Kaiserbacteria bacterium]|nr:PAS domain-containing protein [Candidatus Kaiserbacteria bacterium]